MPKPETRNQGRIIAFLQNAALSFLRQFVDFIYPPYCILCESYLQPFENIVCQKCWSRQQKLEIPFLACDQLKRKPGEKWWLDGSLALFKYSSATQQLVHYLKYKRFTKLAKPFGRDMAKVLAGEPWLETIDAMIPVPLHPKRLRERGFNQSYLLAKAAVDQLKIKVWDDALIRTRYTQPQAKMQREERLRNVTNAFKFNSAASVENKNVVLVDDVFTTGSTMNECARILRMAGAKKVTSLTIVRV